MEEKIWNYIVQQIENGTDAVAKVLLAQLSRDNVSKILARLSIEAQTRAISLLPPREAILALKSLPNDQQTELLKRLGPKVIEAIENELN